MNPEEIKQIYDLICKHDIKSIIIKETENKTKTIFVNYEN